MISTSMANADYSYLDLEVFRKDFQVGQDALVSRFYVDGIKCTKCVAKIESLSGKLEGLEQLRVNLTTHQLELRLRQKSASLANIVRSIEGLGFQLTPIRNESELQSLNSKSDQQDLRRLAVAGICASNIMMFSFAVYFGADAIYKSFFEWLSFGLYLPVVSFVAWPFYKNSWISLKDRSLSIDGPLAMASLSGFVFSVVNLVRGEGSIYFDSLAGFLFLILLSRFVQKRMQRKYLNFQARVSGSEIFKARKLLPDLSWNWVPADQLKENDQIQIQQGELFPADGILVSETVEVDSSYFTGESHAIVVHPEMKVMAGTILLSAQARIKVMKSVQESQFGKLLQKIQSQSLQKGVIQANSDRYASRLVFIVFTLAAMNILVSFLGLSDIPLATALERSLSLIILACPCAMAFGTPLALSFSLKKAFERGFLIKSSDVFAKVAKIENVFLDKTGTLTQRSLQVIEVGPGPITPEQIDIVLGLEQQSSHPIAQALRKYLLPLKGTPKVLSQLRNEVGGVTGFVGEQEYSIKSTESLTGKKSVGLFKGDENLVYFIIGDPLLNESKNLIDKLTSRGLKVCLLSGDSEGEVLRASQELGLSDKRVFSGMTPESKAVAVQGHPRSMVVGDGTNDALAFQKADVSIAVQGAVQTAMKTSDVFFLNKDVSQIDDLFTISKSAISLVQGNLMVSLVYNVIGAVAALLGFINPFVAAVLMPISSGCILLVSWWRSR